MVASRFKTNERIGRKRRKGPKNPILKLRTLSKSVRDAVLNDIGQWAETIEGKYLGGSLRKSLFKKLGRPVRDPRLAEVARTRFLKTESTCRATNAKIRHCLRRNESYADGGILHTASRKIAEILGKFSIEELLDKGRFGPGSTFLCRGKDVSRARKFSFTDVTPEFNKLARGLLAEYPLWSEYLTDSVGPCCPILEVVPGGRYSTVLKDATTDRSIIVEPTINSWFQQGIGRMIRHRLKRSVGVDLDDQSINRRLAKLGSISGTLATVDLSDASDLISRKLVQDLLPEEWFFWLDITRSHRVRMGKDEWVELEKFSSMGNGFTFDLEALVFYALSWAVTVHQGYNPFWVNVMGDDIIVPVGVKDKFLEVFSDVGFTVNVNKSYFDGPFRESCGHDYAYGCNVRGVYLKTLETDIDLMRIHNRIYEWSLRYNVDWTPLRRKLLRQLSHIRARVPPHLGDVGIYSSFDESSPTRPNDGTELWIYRTLKFCLRTAERSDRFLLLDRLQGSEFQHNTVALRDKAIGYRYSQTPSHF